MNNGNQTERWTECPFCHELIDNVYAPEQCPWCGHWRNENEEEE